VLVGGPTYNITPHACRLYINELRNTDSRSYNESIENLRSMKCIPTNNKGFKFADMVVTQVDNCHCN
jgi:hypothetical protein